MVFKRRVKKLEGTNRLKQLAEVFFLQIQHKPSKFGLTPDQAKNITINGLLEEVIKYRQGTQTKDWVPILFYKLIRDGISKGFYQTKDGRMLNQHDF